MSVRKARASEECATCEVRRQEFIICASSHPSSSQYLMHSQYGIAPINICLFNAFYCSRIFLHEGCGAESNSTHHASRVRFYTRGVGFELLGQI